MGKNVSYAVEAIMYQWVCVCVCVHMCVYALLFVLTFSAHAHKPIARNAAPSNCKTKHREDNLVT